jgi:hypothetical protein
MSDETFSNPTNESFIFNQEADAAYARMTEDLLKDCLLKKWDRVDRGTLRDEFAPLLYHLRKRLRAPGRDGEGFEKWVDENLGIAIRTANRWASWYAEQIGMNQSTRSTPHRLSVPKRNVLSLGHVAETVPEELDDVFDSEDAVESGQPEYLHNEAHPVPFQIMLTDDEETEWDHALEVLPDNRVTSVIFEAVTKAAKEIPAVMGVVQ